MRMECERESFAVQPTSTDNAESLGSYGVEVLADLLAAVDAGIAALPAARNALAEAVERAIGIMDAIDAVTEDLEEEPDLEDGADDEDGADREAVDEDGDALDVGEADGWRRPRRARVLHTEWPVALAEREGQRLAVVAALATSSNVVRFPGGRHG